MDQRTRQREIEDQGFTQHALVLGAAKANLLAWAKLIDKEYAWPEHIRIMADTLMKVEKGEITRLLVEMPPRHGKQCAHSVPLFTPDGWRKHGDLQPGDYVFGGDGLPKKILAVSEESMASVEVCFFDGHSIKVHPNHEWLVRARTRRGKEVVLETKYIRNLGTIENYRGKIRAKFTLPPKPCLLTDDADLPVEPYTMGAWLGDGTSSNPYITHAPGDSLVISRVQKDGYVRTKVYEHKTTGVLTSSFTASGEENRGKLQNGLMEAGVWKNKHIPQQYKLASPRQRLELLAGLIDTDGSVGSDNRVRIVTASERLADDIVDLIYTMGWRASVHAAEPCLSSSGIQGTKTVYYVGFTPDGTIPTVIPRKAIVNFPEAQRGVGIKEIRDCEPEPGKCIQVEGGLYLVGKNFITTHNSALCTATFPGWFLGRNPDKRVIIASHTANLAHKMSRISRNNVTEWGKEVFSIEISKDSKAQDRWDLDTKGGLVAAGVGGPLTGQGSDCLVGSAKIQTAKGVHTLEQLVEMSEEDRPQVFSWNYWEKRVELKPILATKASIAKELVEIQLTSGEKLLCTPEHRVYCVIRGFVEAQEVHSGFEMLYRYPCSGEIAVTEVKSVKHKSRMRSDPKVYDIQVANNHNFFADNVLVHNCMIIDDPIKTADQAYSRLQRDKIWDWYANVARTRMHPGGRIIIVATRWHEDDLTGRVMARSPEAWHRLRLPALAEENDPMGRQEGDALWPDRYSDHELYAIKNEIGNFAFSALYQQNPVPAEGGIIKREWLRFYQTAPDKMTRYIQSWDMSFKESSSGSYVVGQVWGLCGRNKSWYLLDQYRQRAGFTDTIRAIKSMTAKWPETGDKFVEDKANGPAVLDVLKGEIPGMRTVDPSGSKEARVRAIEPLFESGCVYLPDPEENNWVYDFIEELLSFPKGHHDDQVDAMSQALSMNSAGVSYDIDIGANFGKRDNPWRL